MGWSLIRRLVVRIFFGLWTGSTAGGFFGGKIKLVTETTKFLPGAFHSHFRCFWSLRSWQILRPSFWVKLTSSPYVSWSYGMVLVVKVSLILFRTFSPKRIGKPVRNFSFQNGWFESSRSITRVRKVFLYHWKSLSFLHRRLERSSAFLSFKWEGSPTKCKEMVRIRVDTTT